jgi:hypothetical protein
MLDAHDLRPIHAFRANLGVHRRINFLRRLGRDGDGHETGGEQGREHLAQHGRAP